MMKNDNTIFVLFSADEWLSTDSQVIMGFFDDFEIMIDCLRDELSNEYDEDEVEDLIEEFTDNGQTQGLDENWLYTTATLNEFGEF